MKIDALRQKEATAMHIRVNALINHLLIFLPTAITFAVVIHLKMEDPGTLIYRALYAVYLLFCMILVKIVIIKY